MRTAILLGQETFSASAYGQVCTWVSMWGMGGYPRGCGHTQGTEPGHGGQFGPEARSEPSTPVFTIVFNHFVLVVSFSYSSELAHHGQTVHPHLGLGRNALPVFLCIYFSVDVKSLQDSSCMEIIGPSSPIILHNFYFGLYKGKE